MLLDVCTPVHVRQALLGHEIHTAVKMGWGQLENGELLRVAESSRSVRARSLTVIYSVYML